MLRKVKDRGTIGVSKQLCIKQIRTQCIPVLAFCVCHDREATLANSIASGQDQDKGSKLTPVCQVTVGQKRVVELMYVCVLGMQSTSLHHTW